MQLKLTPQNFSQGFLIDEEWLGGVHQVNASPLFHVYIIHFIEGQTIEERFFTSLAESLRFLNAVPRDWTFEKSSGCGGETCGAGECQKENCGIFSDKKRLINETNTAL